jgi:SAM-dependent methyltransferase
VLTHFAGRYRPAAVDLVQRDQPPGVPPLALDGERTLPDVPGENYWYRRHLVVYDVLAGAARSVLGIEPNPDAYEHARLRYPGVAFRRDIAETFIEPCDAVVFLQTIEHVADPGAVLDHIRSQLRPGGVAYVSTPNVLTLAPEGAERSDNPWHVREYRPEEFRALCAAHFGSVELLGVFHARMLRVHEIALRVGWDRVHRTLRVTKPFYERFVPAIGARDFALRGGELEDALDLVAVLR